jgi:hypothetical protein
MGSGINMKLDKKRPYAEIIGSTDGSKYEQDGVVFDGEGNAMNQSKQLETQSSQVIIDAPKKRGPKPKVGD